MRSSPEPHECLLVSQLFEEQTDSLNPMMEVRNVKLLVGSVQVVIRQAKAHHHAGNFQALIEIVDDRDRAAAANEYSFFLKRFAKRLGSGLDIRIVRAHYASRTFAVHFDLGLDALRRELLH